MLYGPDIDDYVSALLGCIVGEGSNDLIKLWGSYITNCGGVWIVNEVVFAIRLQGGATPNGRFDSFPLQY
jgi:hypothetical protein|tara:strand:- start:5412 stop:5621 length:210 start_codon:yes stop_codon:yes gene_type:complete